MEVCSLVSGTFGRYCGTLDSPVEMPHLLALIEIGFHPAILFGPVVEIRKPLGVEGWNAIHRRACTPFKLLHIRSTHADTVTQNAIMRGSLRSS
jgi:hypothetical protein